MGEPDALLTLCEAAKLAGRSYGWARDRAVDGRFERREIAGGRIAVTARSVANEIAAQAPPGAVRRPDRRAHLRLVVDNTK